jgi:predicted metal-binding membrane protein
VKLGIYGIAAAAVLALVVLESSSYGRFLDHHAALPAGAGGEIGALALFMGGWALMMLAMMLPTATTLLDAVGRLVDDRRQAVRLQSLSAVGFVGAWMATGYVFRVGDLPIHALADAFGWVAKVLPAGALVFAGLYQFSSLKHRCLTVCRSPSTLVYKHWRGRGDRDALRVGVAYGLSCVGCCWALMLVLFALGAASVVWMLAFGVLMAAEKRTAASSRRPTLIGLALFAAATWAAVHA